MDDCDLVLSDVHLNSIPEKSDDGLQYTRFKYLISSKNVHTAATELDSSSDTPIIYDEDGDFILPTTSHKEWDVIGIFHHMSTSLSLVGLQIWRGALLMSDFVLSKKELFENKYVLELGAGVGLTGIVVGQFATKVICTDVGANILNLCKKNIKENARLLRPDGSVTVERLNWFDSEDCERYYSDPPEVIIACDCVYDDELTDALFRTIYCVMLESSNKRIKLVTYLSLEKRFNFTISDLETTCHEYAHFQKCLDDLRSTEKFSVDHVDSNSIFQYFDYDRVPQLELWEIKLL